MRALGPISVFVIADYHAIVQIVGVGVDIGVIGDRRSFVNDDFSSVIEKHVFVNGAVVLDGQVCSQRKTRRRGKSLRYRRNA